MTVAAVEALERAGRQAHIALSVWLVDDGSSDGTAADVARLRPETHIVQGDGNLFWNGGMRLAWDHARQERADFFLWVNDDLAVLPDAIANALALYAGVAAADHRLIVVGRTMDRPNGDVTYGGYRRASRITRLRFRHLAEEETACDTMNGNFVLLPASAVDDIGLHSAAFRHSFGDIDYGLRARRAGYRIVELKPPVGYQPGNDRAKAMHMRATLADLPKVLTDPKFIPAREWLYFCRQHGGPIWPVNFLIRYVKMVARGWRWVPGRAS